MKMIRYTKDTLLGDNTLLVISENGNMVLCASTMGSEYVANAPKNIRLHKSSIAYYCIIDDLIIEDTCDISSDDCIEVLYKDADRKVTNEYGREYIALQGIVDIARDKVRTSYTYNTKFTVKEAIEVKVLSIGKTIKV